MVDWPGVRGLGSRSSVIEKSIGNSSETVHFKGDTQFPVPVQH